MYIDDKSLERAALGDVSKILQSVNSTEQNAEEQKYNQDSEAFFKLIELWKTKIGGVPVHEHKKPALPSENRRNVLITTALPYVNNVPHLGNIVGSVLSADVFCRFCRMRDYNCVYVGGTDEYGTATETKALEVKCTPRELCDKFNTQHSEIYRWFDIDFDIFGRTSTEKQTEIVQNLFLKLHGNGNFSEDTVDQLYCGSCPRFLADRFVEGTCPFCGYEDARGDQCDKCSKLINAIELKDPRCKICKSSPTVKTSRHLFLDMPKLDSQFREWQKKSSDSGKWTQSAKVITNSWLRDGLKPRCITRDMKWGVPVPLAGYESKVFYVWFDACIGYMSITATYTDQWEKWWRNPEKVELFQFMGKDNVPFHAIVFPMCQIGSGEKFTKVNHVVATEYLNYEDKKFSKSRGVGVFGDQAAETGIPSDVWRFYMMYMRPENQDTSFSWVDLQTKNNSELLNNLGNFIFRCLSFACARFENRVPESEGELEDTDKNVLAQVARYYQEFLENFENLHIRDALRAVLMISKAGNQYVQASKPWEKVKNKETIGRSKTIVYIGIQICALVAGCLEPFMPKTAAELRRQLNIERLVLEDEFRPLVAGNHPLNEPKPLFRKIETEQVVEFQKKFAGQPVAEASSAELCAEEFSSAAATGEKAGGGGGRRGDFRRSDRPTARRGKVSRIQNKST
ncbi:methionine--tRNA ligase, cytoplasmic [Galendromus occidentalis]|uniref:Methionine--tRNA ligase, cytoplasmic n=1 Tax=Galendromus occidentalis TaxID=34638 RepID=A0AAJ6QNW0_9ACAR|nr:methionine--tRNA ligase, cytoplasmic [Galendromus occidentalis]